MSASDKQPPSDSKKARLASDGTLPTSALAVSNLSLAATLLGVAWAASRLQQDIGQLLDEALQLATAFPRDGLPPTRMLRLGMDAVTRGLLLLCVPIVVATVVQLAQSKGRLSPPKISFAQLKPFQGFTSRWAHEARWTLLAKVISTASAIVLAGQLAGRGPMRIREALALLAADPHGGSAALLQAVERIAGGYTKVGLQLLIGGLAGALFDVVMRRRGFDLRHGSDREEQKKEYKEQEGSPELKAAQQQRRFEILMAPPARAMRMADVVVRNPTHIAVAVVDAFGPQPWILMAEEGASAQRVLRLARRYGRPSVRSVALARALLRAGEGADVPADVIAAVTEAAYWAHGLTPPVEESTAAVPVSQ